MAGDWLGAPAPRSWPTTTCGSTWRSSPSPCRGSATPTPTGPLRTCRRGRLETNFRSLLQASDYVSRSRGTAYRLAPTSPSRVLVIASGVALRLLIARLLSPARCSTRGHRVPTPDKLHDAEAASADSEITGSKPPEAAVTHLYPFSPVETVGWKGTLSDRCRSTCATSASHERALPPPSPAPRPSCERREWCARFAAAAREQRPGRVEGAIFFHANVDYDEVLFYHAGDFFSRTGIAPGC
jgi:homogentisate 1,2-dioxygenase